MSRVGLAMSLVGLVIALVGLALAAALGDRFLGLALLLVGAFLLLLPFTRPSVDE